MEKNIIVLGLNFGGHDTSACVMKNGMLIAACEEERYTKQKHTKDFPKNAINDCLKKANISINDVTEITLSYDSNLLKIDNALLVIINLLLLSKVIVYKMKPLSATSLVFI